MRFFSKITALVSDVSGIRLVLRTNYCFPVDFKIQSSTNGSTWTDIVGQTYTQYYNPGGTTQIFPFSSLVSARYLRIYATKLSWDGTNYYLHLGEVYVDC